MTTRKTVQLPAEIHQKLKIESALSGEDMQTIVIKAIEEELKKRAESRK